METAFVNGDIQFGFFLPNGLIVLIKELKDTILRHGKVGNGRVLVNDPSNILVTVIPLKISSFGNTELIVMIAHGMTNQ